MSVVLFQRTHVHINLHFLCDLLYFVLGENSGSNLDAEAMYIR